MVTSSNFALLKTIELIENYLWHHFFKRNITSSKITSSKLTSLHQKSLCRKSLCRKHVAIEDRLSTKWSNLLSGKWCHFWWSDQIVLLTKWCNWLLMKWSNCTFDEVIKLTFKEVMLGLTMWSNCTFDKVIRLNFDEVIKLDFWWSDQIVLSMKCHLTFRPSPCESQQQQQVMATSDLESHD